MKEHPILFNSENVRAILEGRKTQTRRVATRAISKWEVGDRLWVRETWWTPPHNWRLPEPEKNPTLVSYKEIVVSNCGTLAAARQTWLPSIFMPRWASRITLEIVRVRVERLEEITQEDVIAEGISRYTLARGCASLNPPDPRWKFIELWDSLNAKRGYGWAVNPWVWVIKFKMPKAEVG